jgi:hypothetical protein
MPAAATLPGVNRLIAVCRQRSLSLKLSPPLASAPKEGEAVFGESFDPQLAAIYQRLGASEFGPLTLYGPSSEREGLIPRNEWLRAYDGVHLQSSHVFGWETGFAYYYGTVPRLADSQGLQPVIYIDDHEAKYAVPVASSVDRFFDAYSHYLELMAVDSEYVHHGVSVINFPWSMAQVIARDTPLMEQVFAGRFDFLTNGYRDALDWLQQLRAARPWIAP